MPLLVSPVLDQSPIFWKTLRAKQTVYSLQMLQQRPVKQITPQGIWNQNEILNAALIYVVIIESQGGFVPVALQAERGWAVGLEPF